MILINGNSLTVKYNGEVYSKQITDEEKVQVQLYALDTDYDSIIGLCFSTGKSLLNKEGFWEDNGSVYYKNIKVSIPQVLVEKFNKATEEEFQRLIKFWSWLSLNPNSRTRENLYGWVEKNGIQLTEGGLMILYRRVYKLSRKDSKLATFVENTYEKLRKQKKSTNVGVYLYDNYLYTTNEIVDGERCQQIGNLKELYHQEPEQVYTDAHTRTKRYMIGVEEREPRSAGDESEAGCSTGLHCASINYNYSGFGDTPIVVVVNPKDVLNAIDNFSKIRTCAFTPVAVLNTDCEWINDTEVHERIDACYDVAVEQLEQLLAEAKFEDFNKHEVLANKWNLSVGFESVLKILNNGDK